MRKHCAIWWSWGTALAAVVLVSCPAQAFYWYGWPGSGVPTKHTLTPPGNGKNPGKGTGSPGKGTGSTGTGTAPPDNGGGNPPGGEPIDTPPSSPGGGSGTQTPEPATALAALLGMGALATGRTLRQLRKPTKRP